MNEPHKGTKKKLVQLNIHTDIYILYRGQTNSKCTTSEWKLEIHKAYPEPIIIAVKIINVNVKQ